MKFNLANIQHDLFASANIFWKKNSGATICLSKKGDVLNLNLIKKLLSAGCDLEITDSIDHHAFHEIEMLYEKYSEEVLMRDKLNWRSQVIEKLRMQFIERENVLQSDLDLLAWKLFSNFEYTEGMAFIEKDSELFKRHLSVASAYTFSAFLLGYYEPVFLKRLFSKTLMNLMELGESIRVLSLKEKLEYLRLQDSFSSEDCEYVKSITKSDVLMKTVLFEKYDGSGPRQINSREMTDLDLVFVAISKKFGFVELKQVNVLKEIVDGKLECERRTLKMLQTVLSEKTKNQEAAA